MIHLEQNQTLKSDEKVRVSVPTGDYNETDLIECYADGGDPNTPTMMYQAQYIGLGNPIYQQSEELTEDQVTALVGGKGFDEVINNRKLIDGKRPAAKFFGRVVKRKGTIEKREARKDLDAATAPTITPQVPQGQTNQQATTTPNTIDQPDTTSVSSTTPQTVSTSTPSDVSTTTPAFIDTSTTTPSTLDTSTTTPAVDTSTTTPPTLDTSTTTPLTNFDTSSTTPSVTASSTPIDIPTTTDQLVTYAKRKIAKKIFKL